MSHLIHSGEQPLDASAHMVYLLDLALTHVFLDTSRKLHKRFTRKTDDNDDLFELGMNHRQHHVYTLSRDNPMSGEATGDKFELDSSLGCLTPCCPRQRYLARSGRQYETHKCSPRLRTTFTAAALPITFT
ncbi:Uncharacterized protein DBV15_10279 [Temnothorax longispinosus]|uniref:Uncharacterized protein n=1 Tax=Temnothorax longispinosus TaxID=300112 RepID=A0A4V3SBP2_9HYME|nr:Uncharacterized protein DBV15_10279 [Temnothorax longispinosus]